MVVDYRCPYHTPCEYISLTDSEKRTISCSYCEKKLNWKEIRKSVNNIKDKRDREFTIRLIEYRDKFNVPD